MAHFNRRNLVLFDDTEVQYYNSAPANGYVVLVSLEGPQVHIGVGHKEIEEALRQQAGVHISSSSISRYRHDYMVYTSRTEVTNKILTKEALHIEPHSLAVYPLLPDHGSSEHDIDATLPNQTIEATAPRHTANIPEAPVALKLVITRVPPVFWFNSDQLVPRIFRKWCDITGGAKMNTRDLSCEALTYAAPSGIPTMAHVGIRRSDTSGSKMNIWPIWIRVKHADPDDIQSLNAILGHPHQRVLYTMFEHQIDGDDGAAEAAGTLLPSRTQAGYFIEAPPSENSEPEDSDEELLILNASSPLAC